VGLISLSQWNGQDSDSNPVDIAPSVNFKGKNNDEKIEIITSRLLAGQDVYNWKNDPRYSAGHPESKTIGEYVGGKTVNEILVNVDTGENDNDYGEFMLVTLVRDIKLSPHPKTYAGDLDTLKSRIKCRVYEINIIDDNIPLIVFDTVDLSENPTHNAGQSVPTGDSPEENTFPKLTDGEFFDINGYTLRENNSDKNSVERFRMAWIPQGVIAAGVEKDIIKQVENALRWYLDPYEPRKQDEYQFPAGVQYWTMDEADFVTKHPNAAYATNKPLQLGSSEYLTTTNGVTTYKKQVFRKTFSVLYKQDDVKSSYKNFTYINEGKDVNENEMKVFVFCAIDNMQKVVFRTLRLLPNKTPPTLTVYDITGKNITGLSAPPNPYDVIYGSPTGDITPGYEADRRQYNSDSYPNLKAVSLDGSGNIILGDGDLSQSLQSYPRKTSVKYWVFTQKSGELAIKSIKMEDKTVFQTYNLGYESKTDHALSYIEYFPEVTSRTFLFTVEDSLGNVAQVQRTIAITNAATLINITTEKLSGTYGLNDKIIIKANFDSKIEIDGNINNVFLNVRYPKTDDTFVWPDEKESDYNFKQIPCTKANDLSLEFEFSLTEGDVGYLQTMFNDPKMFFTKTDMNKPITLKNGTKIIDSQRRDQAFTPGNITGFTWNNDTYSLQDPVNGKQIKLDGIRPKLKEFTVSGKTSAPEHTNASLTGYYFKAGETLIFEIKADKDIRTSGGAPIISYTRGTTNNTTAFKYQSPAGADGMRFALEINRTNLATDGQITNFQYYSGGPKIVDDVGNEIKDFNTYISAALNNIRIYNDQTAPTAPVTRLSPAPTSPASPGNVGTNPAVVWYYSTGPSLEVDSLSTTVEPYGQTRQYSLDGGLSWTDFTATLSLLNSINNQPWSLQTRIVDKAGNVGVVTSQQVYVSAAFPKITSVNVDQNKGTYTAKAGENALTFVVNFDGYVRVVTQATTTITVTNRDTAGNNTHNTDGTSLSYQIQLQANSGQGSNTQSIKFNWTGIGTAGNLKEMLKGLYVSEINMNGLSDQFGNIGGKGAASVSSLTGVSAITVTPNLAAGDSSPSYTAPNLPEGYIVDAIPPRVDNINPISQAVLTDANRKTITITFNEAVIKGSGIITIKPASDSLIPPVFENDGYYLGTDGNRYTSSAANRTYVDGFYDVYTKSTAANKQALTESTNASSPSWGTLKLNPRTGQTVGPYQRITHGLKIGNGYTGNYSGAYSGGTGGTGGPDPDDTQTGDARYLVPDTATKWVLDFKLRINDTGNSQITAISNALKAVKFRWQEIDVGNLGVSTSENIVTITLNEPLLKGLHWELSYPKGVFTDIAGNDAPAVTSHEFWTTDAQVPVIRVNRRSYDARPVNASGSTPGSLMTSAGAYPASPAANTGWNAGTTVTDINGWGFSDFNTIHYCIESETPNAVIYYGSYNGDTANRITNKSSVTAAFSGSVHDANASNHVADSAWNNRTATDGTWILNNLIRRGNSTYNVKENGVSVTRTAGTTGGTYYGFRSYNKDATIANLKGVSLSYFANSNKQGALTFGELEAGKGYVVATARRTSDNTAGGTLIGAVSDIGYEGVFRTVIAIYNTGDFAQFGTTRAVLVEGTNIKNGIPSIAGFPVKDAEETGDNRYVKMFYRNSTDNAQLTWISTEIVCEWYFLKYGGRVNGSTHMNVGEVSNNLTVGYGDLTYGHNLTSYNDPNNPSP